MTRLRSAITALVAGAVFGVGLVLGGMTDPRRVIGFLDVGGGWDPSLLLVMAGAVAVHFAAYRWIQQRPSPLWAGEFALPTAREIDRRLIAGAALFGIGWAVAGYCPGPALVGLAAGQSGAVVFVAAMLLGTWLAAQLDVVTARAHDGVRLHARARAEKEA